jgi:hypothetical protein
MLRNASQSNKIKKIEKKLAFLPKIKNDWNFLHVNHQLKKKKLQRRLHI